MMKEIALNYGEDELKGLIDRFSDARVVVIGDIIMDEYIWGHVSRISPEAPVPVVEVKQETKMLGGAANVVHNIVSLGGQAILCGVVGKDDTGEEIVHRIKELGIGADGLLVEPDRPTSIKTRIIAHNQQVVRFDRESRRLMRPETLKRLLAFMADLKDGLDVIIIADYGKGVISVEMMQRLRDLVKDSGTLIAVDPKVGNFECYHGIDVITPNHHEAGASCRMEIIDEETLIQAGRQMLQELDCRSVLITQGKEGMTLFEEGDEVSHIPTVARKVFDVTGAGDTVISTFCLGLASGMDMKSAAMISNFAAGIVVGELGTTTVQAEELKRVIHDRTIR